jgi:dipeptidase D
MNAIPRETDVVLLVRPEDEGKLIAKISEWDRIFKNELKISDPGVFVAASKVDVDDLKMFSDETKKKVIGLLILFPDDVQSMSMDIKGLVESSTNLGVVKTWENEVIFESGIRRNIRSLKYKILNQNKTVVDVMGVELLNDGECPEWEFNPNSKLRIVFKKVYNEMYGSEPEVIAVHGGLECGIFTEKNPNLDMVSFGPNMYDVHSSNEHISISSINKMWEYLLSVLKEIK